MRFVVLSAVILGGRGDTPCTQLCLSDGPRICTEGSEMSLDADGYEVCTNYFYIDNGLDPMEITYVTDDFVLKPARIEDIPTAIAGREVPRTKGSQKIETILDSLGGQGRHLTLQMIEAIHGLYVAATTAFTPKADVLNTWNSLGGEKVMELVSRFSNQNKAGPISLLAFALAAPLRHAWSPNFWSRVGLNRLCDSERSTLKRSILSLINEEEYLRASLALYETILSFATICQPLMSEPWFPGALLSLGLRAFSNPGPVLRIELDSLDLAFAKSADLINDASIESLRNSRTGEHFNIFFANPVPSNEAGSNHVSRSTTNRMWFSRAGLDISDSGYLELTEDEAEIEAKGAQYRAIGRFLGMIVASRNPVWISDIPSPLLTALTGQGGSLPHKSNWSIIVAEFHRIVPRRLLERTVLNSQRLKGVLTGEDCFPLGKLINCMKLTTVPSDTRAFLSLKQRILSSLVAFSETERRRLFFRLTGMMAIPSGGFEEIGFSSFEVLAGGDGGDKLEIELDSLSPRIRISGYLDQSALNAAFKNEVNDWR